MAKWKAISWIIRCVVAANLALIAWVLLFHGSRAMGIRAFWTLRASALTLLVLVPAEYALRRHEGAQGRALILDAALMVVIFLTWLTISAATF
jgi:hypothetical protein